MRLGAFRWPPPKIVCRPWPPWRKVFPKTKTRLNPGSWSHSWRSAPPVAVPPALASTSSARPARQRQERIVPPGLERLVIRQRLGDETTAHESGIFRYTATGADGKNIRKSYIHFEALLLKRDGWKIMMEYQKFEATVEEWNALH